MNWKHLDTQMNAFKARLTSEVKLTAEMAAKLATTIASDLYFVAIVMLDAVNEPSQ
ncbi:MAG: hypothetical protein ACYDBV_00995 [Nitrospiria bacterium]